MAMPPPVDGRAPFEALQTAHKRLAEAHGFDAEVVFVEPVATDDGPSRSLPCEGFTSALRGRALWLITGVHGEEPAGPNALAQHVDALGELARTVPLVVLPLCNPLGYVRGWRYPNAPRVSDDPPGCSVGDSEHLLLSRDGGARAPAPVSPQADALTRWVLSKARAWPPALVIDLHEDDGLDEGYIYAQGPLGAGDPIAGLAVEALVAGGVSLCLEGVTRFGEPIRSGVVDGAADGSIDELLAARRILFGGAIVPGPAASSVIVVETGARQIPLAERVRGHRALLAALPHMFPRVLTGLP